MMTFAKYIVFGLIIGCMPLSVQADTLIFKNGDRLSGEITSQSETGYTMRTHFGTTLSIDKTKLAGIHLSIPGRVIPFQEAVSTAEETPEVEKAEETTHIEESDRAIKWSGSLQFGASLESGNTDANAVDFDGKTTARREDDRFILSFEYDREEDDGDITTDEKKLKGIYDYFFAEEKFLNAKLSFEQDELSNVDLRSRYGLGLGHQPFESEKRNLKYVASLLYLREDFSGQTPAEDSLALGWDLDYDQAFYNDLYRFYHEHTLDIPLDAADAFILDTETGIKVPLSKKLHAAFAIEFDWDNDPAQGIKEEDIEYNLKLGYEW